MLVKEKMKQYEEGLREVMELALGEHIFDEIVNIDAIDKWAPMIKQIENNETITFHDRKPSNLDISDNAILKAISVKSDEYKDIVLNQMDVKSFEYWIMPLKQLEDTAKIDFM